MFNFSRRLYNLHVFILLVYTGAGRIFYVYSIDAQEFVSSRSLHSLSNNQKQKSVMIVIAPLSSAAFYAGAKQFYLKIWLEEDLSWQNQRLEARRKQVSVRVPASDTNRKALSRVLTTQEKIKVTLDPSTQVNCSDKYQGQIKLFQGDDVECVPSQPTS